MTDTKQSPTNLGLFLEGVYCLVVFQTSFNPNNSLLIILQISLLFRFTPALSVMKIGPGCYSAKYKLLLMFKLVVYTFKALHGSAPTYIHQLIRPKPQSNYNPTRPRKQQETGRSLQLPRPCGTPYQMS